MKRYYGEPFGPFCGITVFEGVGNRCLEPIARYHVFYKQTKIGWGPNSSNEQRLNCAFTILADCMPERAEALHPAFFFEKISKLPDGCWEMSEDDILEWAARHQVAAEQKSK